MKYFRLLTALLLAAALSVTGSFHAAAEQGVPAKQPIVVDGDHVEYLQGQKKVIGYGNVSIKYNDIVLTCERIEVDITTHEAVAEGNVTITQNNAYFIGDKINYNFDTRSAAVDYGYVNANPFFGRAENMDKAAGKDEFSLMNGSMTTCDLDRPHYRIKAERIRIYVDDRVVANNVMFLIGDVPVFYLPYYVQPLRHQKKSHITVIPGRSKDWGYYALTAYRYYLSDNNRGDILLDYRAKKGLGGGINHYIDSEVGSGAFKAYYAQEGNKLAFDDNTGETVDRYRYQYRHRWDMKEYDTNAILEFNYLSDPDIIRDYFYNEYEELGANPDSYLSLITSKENYTTEFLVRKRFNNFYNVVERMPEYKIDIMNYKIGDTDFYYSSNTSGVYLNQTFAKTADTPKDQNTIRLDTYQQISYAMRFFRTLNVTPYAGIRETYYSRNRWGDTNVARTAFSEGVDASIKFYKIYDVNTNFAGLDINKIRHVITPTASYYHTHQPTISPDNLFQFDSIDALDTQNGVRLGLENKLQTKRRVDGEQMSSVDLLRFIVSTDYMFRLDKQSLEMKSDKFNGVDFKLELVPYTWLYLNSDMHVNSKTCEVETANVDFVASGEKWSLSVGQRYYNLDYGKSYQVTMDGKYAINDKWKIRFYERFDLETNKFEQQQYTLTRDLHCWLVDFTYDIRDEGNHTVWVIFTLKAFPDYPIGFKQTYSQPRFGSTGSAAGPS